MTHPQASIYRLKRALVTGATGYVGSQLVAGLLRDGCEVHVITRASSSLVQLEPFLSCISVHVHDGTTHGMLDVFATVRPSIVFHIAAKVMVEHKAGDIDDLIGTNVLFSTQILEGMRSVGTRYFVNTETFWQHQDGSSQYAPVCLYAATKQAFLDVLINYVNLGQVEAISLVLYDVYGANDPRQKLFSFLKQAFAANQEIALTPGEQKIALAHIDDVVSAFLVAGGLLLSDSSPGHRRYGVHSGEMISLRQLLALIGEIPGIEPRVNWGAKPYRTNEIMNPWLCPTIPGWSAQKQLNTGLHEVFASLGSNGTR